MVKKKFLITGAAGFIGNALYKKMVYEKYDVKGLDNFKFSKNVDKNIIRCDLLNLNKLKKVIESFDIVIHLAGIDSRDYFKKKFNYSYDVNVEGSKNVIYSLTNKKKLYFFSSNQVYGNANYLPVDEDHSTNTTDPYAISKLIVENMIKIYSYSKGYKYCVVRNFNTFGPHQNEKSMIPSLIIDALKNKRVDIWSGQSIRDLQFIDDLVDNFLLLIESKNDNEIINLSSGEPVKMNYLGNIISKITKSKLKVVNKKKFLVKNYGSINKLKKITQGKIKISSLKDSLQKTIEFYKKKV